MPSLKIYNREIESFFELLGVKENDISYSVGYTFSRCREFLKQFLALAGVTTGVDVNAINITLQSHERGKGFTDFEIYQENLFHFIVEAKRGWTFPSSTQLNQYCARTGFVSSSAPIKKVLVFNESIPAFTKAHFEITKIGGYRIEVMSWQTLQNLIPTSKKTGRDAENRVLNDLNTYLTKISTMQPKDSNWVYVVSLGAGGPEKWNISWKDIVNKYKKYFHPVGGTVGGWPAEPPNYIAFRYDGKLQSIHHIDSYQVFTDPSLHFASVPKDKWGPCYLYELGPAIKPTQTVSTGAKITRNTRVWAMLDLLLTCKSIEEARNLSKLR